MIGFKKRLCRDPVNVIGTGLVAGMFAWPFIHYFTKNLRLLSKLYLLKRQLSDKKLMKFYQGPLHNTKDRYMVTNVVIGKNADDISEGLLPGHVMTDSVLSVTNVKRCDELDIPFDFDDYDDDIVNENFHRWLEWDHVSNDVDTHQATQVTKAHIISGNNKQYTVAFSMKKNFLEYYAISDGTVKTLYENIEQDTNIAGFFMICNIFPIATIMRIWLKHVHLVSI